ncbi:MAG: 2-hydroxyacyl-CoA dehydratase [Spirochaetes bacterium]|nr:2-hydroxyacyl-CoA dehydratase [Spirochaetota bacterium]
MDYSTLKQSLEQLRKKGPSIGWFCTYTPEEIIHAAGYTPVGIRVSSGFEDDDVHLGRNMCSFVHSIFGAALNGEYEYLDGVIIPHCCECMRRLYDGWELLNDSVKPRFAYQLDVPDANTQISVEYFTTVLRRFMNAMEDKSQMKITDETLMQSIDIYNETRSLLRRLYDLRKRDNPPVTGEQVLEILDLCMTVPKEDFNREFGAWLAGIEAGSEPAFHDYRSKIAIYGGMFNPEIIKYVEKDGTGGIVVCEDACNGIRYFESAVDLTRDEDPVKALARRYLSKMPCPRMAGRRYGDRMPEDLLKLVQEFRAEGVVYYITKRCENLYWEFPFIKETLDKHNIPLKRLEGDISGDIRTREIKSFIELLDF